jgi:hypothetical protein
VRVVRAGRAVAADAAACVKGLAGPAAGTALGQRQRDEGRDHAGGDAEPGRDALVQPAAGEQRQRACRDACSARRSTARCGRSGRSTRWTRPGHWVQRFVAWYNSEHRHSALKFVTPAQRHTGEAEELLRKRIELYEAARARHPERWSGNIRNWVLAPIVCLNPERTKRYCGKHQPREKLSATTTLKSSEYGLALSLG